MLLLLGRGSKGNLMATTVCRLGEEFCCCCSSFFCRRRAVGCWMILPFLIACRPHPTTTSPQPIPFREMARNRVWFVVAK